ncbi:probable ADP-ribosylation factor GTPase-activating protein AGD14 isoform X2 [Tripterygium wilfordii]|uniref:probable ADP-ribosylation factor GTPase-activating protein AGD14 isoform X2 n=1 Tax=Tripterygium wilfordii TaxID=458696 RepID=UPI0018F83813|nr:probable ADP-ribosylation factor GTPase-activating protein AGD14 isoform X2 [Tripterygium wilfordii]XP_038725666.1 probable ADP-ribosylation factor GTPase-activating protein AGD14 isoform X2 [Tripterygium wilfordii]
MVWRFREFTHRVKSVSMAKFTSQEVEALQNGGNQCARELYMKDWDFQRQRFPDSSNADKVREFIKHVYVDKKYAGSKTSDKPPRDLQGLRNREDETRRASSYHSYSQSPPYDYQYEDRRYGRHAASLTRKPGSDKGLYVGKASSFVSSPGGVSEQMYEDRFANDDSVSRFSDYSVSSGGDPVRTGAQSPFQKDSGFSSPPVQSSRVILNEHVQSQAANFSPDANFRRDAERIPCPQRAKSSGSFGSFDSSSISLKSYNSGSLLDVVLEPEHASGAKQGGISAHTESFAPVGYDGSELSKVSVAPEEESSAAVPLDLFQSPAATLAPVDLFQQSLATPALSANSYHVSQFTQPSSLDIFATNVLQQSATVGNEKPMVLSVPKNEGWASFDTPPAASKTGAAIATAAVIPVNGVSFVDFDQRSSANSCVQWPSFPNTQESSLMPDPWHVGVHNIQTPTNTMPTQAWSAFDSSVTLNGKHSNELQVAPQDPSFTLDQYSGLRVSEVSTSEFQNSHSDVACPSSLASQVTGLSYIPAMPPLMMGTVPNATDYKSTNPFDLPYDSDLEQTNMFLDMSSLQATLPNSASSSTYLGGVTPSWFPQESVAAYIPAATQGGLAYMAGQATSSQLPNVAQTQGSVASVGRNPFA